MDIYTKAFLDGFIVGKAKGKASGGGGAELNIAYGDTAPEDTSKIWVKSNRPANVRVETLKFTEIKDYPYEEAKHYVGRACVPFGNQIYLLGGTSNMGSNTGTSTVYDTVTKETRQIAGVPRYGTLPRAVADGNTVHFFAGSNWSVFYQDREAWDASSTSIPSDYQGSACCLVDGFVYFFGGGTAAKSTIGKLNLETKEFSGCDSSFSYKRHYISCASIGKNVYLFGGKDGSGYSLSTAMLYDTENDSLSSLKSMPSSAYDMGCLVYGDDILLLGGYFKNSISEYGYLDQVVLYKPSTDEYLPCDGTLSKKRIVEGCAMVGETVYLMGVRTSDTEHEIEMFRVTPPVENQTLAMQYKTEGTRIPIINAEAVHIETEIGGAYMGDENNVGRKIEVLMYKDGEWTNI